jgi:hypothetical protein
MRIMLDSRRATGIAGKTAIIVVLDDGGFRFSFPKVRAVPLTFAARHAQLAASCFLVQRIQMERNKKFGGRRIINWCI